MKKLLVLVLSVALVVSVFMPVSSSAASTSKKITVWSHLTQDEVKALTPIANQWAKKTGNTVKVVFDTSDFQAYLQAAQSSKGPDIMFGIPHDNLGTFIKANLIEPVPANTIKDSDYASKALLDACTMNGKRYAIPLAMETYAMFYNTSKVKTAPKTTDELIAVAKKVGFKYDINNFYFTYAWISGFGGYVFSNHNGTLDPRDLGLGGSEATKAYKFIQDLVQVDKFMNADIKGDDAKAAFSSQQTGLYISGPWDVKGFQDKKVPFAVAPLPAINGTTAKSFMGVQAAFVSAKSQNKALAWDLLKYLAANSAEALYKVGNRIPALNSELNKDYVKNDPITKAFSEQARFAEPMPNIPQMAAVWTPAGNNLILLTGGKQTPEKTAQNIVKQILQGIAQQK